jgi:hypothetical protein
MKANSRYNRQVRVALLLPLRQVDLAARPVQTLFDAGNDLLWQETGVPASRFDDPAVNASLNTHPRP